MTAARAIAAADLDERLAGLLPIGLSEHGTTRLPWTPQDTAAGAWFAEQAATCGLRVERDPAGNRWAVPDAPGPWWAVGSHLDSVRCGGRFDGALGVAAGFAVAAATRVPVAVLALADEEGARWGTPTFGSRALAGRLDAAGVLDRVDVDGVRMRDALGAAGVEPGRIAEAATWLPRLRGFLELHVDQARDLARAGVPAAAVRALAARRRWELELHGRADHAGTTPRDEREDALLAAARVVVAADALAQPPVVATVARMLVEPNAPTTIARRVRLWLDARAPAPLPLDVFEAGLRVRAAGAEIALASRSDGTPFDDGVRAAFGLDAPATLCFAGHDAGILAAGIPTGMVLVRNPSGVSHAPEEHVSFDDAALGAQALLRAVEALA